MSLTKQNDGAANAVYLEFETRLLKIVRDSTAKPFYGLKVALNDKPCYSEVNRDASYNFYPLLNA